MQRFILGICALVLLVSQSAVAQIAEQGSSGSQVGPGATTTDARAPQHAVTRRLSYATKCVIR